MESTEGSEAEITASEKVGALVSKPDRRPSEKKVEAPSGKRKIGGLKENGKVEAPSGKRKIGVH